MPITDLTGYIWVGNDILNAPSNEDNYGGWVNYNIFNPVLENDPDYPNGVDNTCYRLEIWSDYLIMGGDPVTSLAIGSYISDFVAYDSYDGGWINDMCKTIQITGGTDVTNADLIDWLEANGTLTAPAVVTPSISVGAAALSGVFIGNLSVQKMIYNGVTLYEREEPTEN